MGYDQSYDSWEPYANFFITGKEKDYHVSDMKPFVFDFAMVDPLDIARRDQMEFFIEKILDHRGN